MSLYRMTPREKFEMWRTIILALLINLALIAGVVALATREQW
jgi:hypothetical protein